MLESLRIRNLALVENLAVDFEAGLNVITGETGAGKSIVMGALGLLVGDRADRTLIRAGEDQCTVEAVVRLRDPASLDALLAELGLAPTEDGQLILRRIVSASGAGRNLVNDSPATLQALKRIGERLVDMHGPHDHQSLLGVDYQIDLLDAFGQHREARDSYAGLYADLRGLEAKRRELEGGEEDTARQLDFLAFQVRELDEAALVAGEDDEVEREHRLVANAQQVLELADGAVSALSEGEGSALQALAAAQHALDRLAPLAPDAAAWRDEARQAAVVVKELAATIASYAQSVEADPQRQQWLEERMAVYHRLKRKYGLSVPELLARLDELRGRLRELQTRGERLAELTGRIDSTRVRMTEAAERLRRRRKSAAGRLAAAVTGELRDLGFPHGAFAVDLREDAPGPRGMDAVEFGFAPNPGEPSRPLRAIASSGEISRVMLAVKTVLAGHDRIPILVFDEIDANVGGETANAVGLKLANLGATHQVLCITHLPQVAAHGGPHFAVTKSVEGARTRTRIARLDEKARTEEIARMLGGRDLTSVVLQHAREMIARSAAPRRAKPRPA